MFKGKWRSAGLVSGILILLAAGTLFASEEDQDEAGGTYLRERPIEFRIKVMEKPEKEKLKQPERVLDVLGVKEAEVVADVGAGTGFFTFHLSPRVGPEGVVYAVEIEDKFIDLLRVKAEQKQINNIIIIKSSELTPNLPDSSCDKIVMSGVYYYLNNPAAFMGAVRSALKPGGKLALIDLDEEKFSEHTKEKRKDLLKLPTTRQIIEQMEKAGFELYESHNFLSQRFLLIFTTAR